jgi:hypothetical protein
MRKIKLVETYLAKKNNDFCFRIVFITENMIGKCCTGIAEIDEEEMGYFSGNTKLPISTNCNTFINTI